MAKNIITLSIAITDTGHSETLGAGEWGDKKGP